VRDVVVSRNHRSDLIEEASLPTETIVDWPLVVPYDVGVLRRAVERPLEHRAARSAERLAILFDDDRHVSIGERSHNR